MPIVNIFKLHNYFHNSTLNPFRFANILELQMTELDTVFH